MQILIIAGNVGRDAELRTTQNGDKVLGFSLAVDNGKDKPATWVDCSVWGKRAESLNGHITKGKKLTVSGRPSVRAHEGKGYLGVSVDQLTFMGGPVGPRSSDTGQGAPASHQNPMPMEDEDSIPFTYEWRV